MPSKVCCREPIAADAAIRVVGAWPTRWSKTTIFRRSIARPAEPTRCKKSQSIWAKPLPNRNRWSPWCVAAARATNARIRTFTTERRRAPSKRRCTAEKRDARTDAWATGDCVAACQFGAIVVNPETGLPEVDETKCTACGACVKACPRNIIELRKKSQRTPHLRRLREPRQRGRLTESMRRVVYRLRQVRQDLPVRSHYPGKQSCLHRCRKVPTVPQMRRRMPDRRN